jgi:hypothetical protein
MSGGAARTRRLAEALAALDPPLRPIARSVLAEASRIDVVALDPDGRAVVLVDGQDDDRAGFTRALAAAGWLEARLSDWRQLAPGSGIDVRAPVRALLVARRFSQETRAAARLLGSARIGLLLSRSVAAGATPRAAEPPAPDRAALVPRSLAPSVAAGARPAAGLPRAATGTPRRAFRCGLGDSDLGVRESSA